MISLCCCRQGNREEHRFQTSGRDTYRNSVNRGVKLWIRWFVWPTELDSIWRDPRGDCSDLWPPCAALGEPPRSSGRGRLGSVASKPVSSGNWLPLPADSSYGNQQTPPSQICGPPVVNKGQRSDTISEYGAHETFMWQVREEREGEVKEGQNRQCRRGCLSSFQSPQSLEWNEDCRWTEQIIITSWECEGLCLRQNFKSGSIENIYPIFT